VSVSGFPDNALACVCGTSVVSEDGLGQIKLRPQQHHVQQGSAGSHVELSCIAGHSPRGNLSAKQGNEEN
jgi:hypothetical protein